MSKLLFFTLILSLYSLRSFSQAEVQDVIAHLNTHIRPIKTISANADPEELLFLKETLKDRELVSLGEVTHGTKEVFEYKDKLVRFLVSQMDFRAIAFESDYLSLERIDEYINGKTDSLVFLFGTPLISANRPMIEWLRNFNLTKADSEKVHVYGLEARGFSNIINKILKIHPEIDANNRTVLESISKTDYNKLKREDINKLKTVMDDLPKDFYSTLLNQVLGGYYETKFGFRDAYMAENATDLKEKARNQKLIVWAHNGHVSKTALFKKPSLGTHLYERYGDKYFVIATDFNHGNVYVRPYIARNKPLADFQRIYYPEVSSTKGYEYYFGQCKFENFILDVGEALKNPVLKSFLVRPLDFRLIGARSIPVNTKLSIARNFDMIVYFDKTSSQW